MLHYDPYQIARAHLELWNNRNPLPYKELLTPAATFRSFFEKEEKPAIKGIEQYETLLRTAIPDIKHEHIDVIAAEGTLTIEWVGRGTHLGKIFAVEPTGRHIRMAGTTVLKINEDGKIVKETVYADMKTIMNQIGLDLVPVPEARLREIALALVEHLNHRNVEKLLTLFAPRPLITFNAVPVDQLRLPEVLLTNVVALPDLKVQIHHVAVRGNEVVLEVMGTATHAAPIAAIPPTGKPIKLEGCVVLTFEGEKIAKLRFYGDQYTLLAQIGKVPELVVR